MSKALEQLKEYIERIDSECLSKDENLISQKESLDEWKNKFKNLVLEVVKSIAEFGLFTSDEEKEKYDCDDKKQREKMAKEFIKENIPMAKEYDIEKIMKEYFKVYLPEKDEIYQDFIKIPLTEISDSFGFRSLEDEVVSLIKNNIEIIFAKYKKDLSSSKIGKRISMHYSLFEKFKKWSFFSSVTSEEKKYFLELQEKNILDMLEEYKQFVEGTEATEQKFINELVYAQMLLKENFFNEE